MDHPSATRTCIVTGCGQPARGHFCMDCWTILPWDIKGAMGRARKKNHNTKEAVKHAKEFLENQRGVKVIACRPGDREMLETPAGKALMAAAVTAMNRDESK